MEDVMRATMTILGTLLAAGLAACHPTTPPAGPAPGAPADASTAGAPSTPPDAAPTTFAAPPPDAAPAGGPPDAAPPTPPDAAPAPTAALAGILIRVPSGPCGGARVSPEYRLPPPSPASGVKILVRRGAVNTQTRPVAELTTAADGTFAANLPRGRYCLVLEAGRDRPTQGDRWHQLSCLVSAWQRCEAVVDVPVAAPVRIEHQQSCFGPCYDGPPPP
jgi:hypothetical protein